MCKFQNYMRHIAKTNFPYLLQKTTKCFYLVAKTYKSVSSLCCHPANTTRFGADTTRFYLVVPSWQSCRFLSASANLVSFLQLKPKVADFATHVQEVVSF
jgi:hypothetical protein